MRHVTRLGLTIEADNEDACEDSEAGAVYRPSEPDRPFKACNTNKLMSLTANKTWS